MQVTLNLPDDVSRSLAELGQDVPRYALEAVAVEERLSDRGVD